MCLPLEIKLNLSENGFKRKFVSHTDFRLAFFEHLQIHTRVPQKRNVQLLWASYISSYKHRFTNPFAIHIQRIIHFRCSGKARNQQCSPEMGKILWNYSSLYTFALFMHCIFIHFLPLSFFHFDVGIMYIVFVSWYTNRWERKRSFSLLQNGLLSFVYLSGELAANTNDGIQSNNTFFPLPFSCCVVMCSLVYLFFPFGEYKL